MNESSIHITEASNIKIYSEVKGVKCRLSAMLTGSYVRQWLSDLLYCYSLKPDFKVSVHRSTCTMAQINMIPPPNHITLTAGQRVLLYTLNDES